MQDKVLELSADLWNAFLNIPINERHPDDTNDIRFHIHAIQNILFTQKYKSEKIKFEIKVKDIESCIIDKNKNV